MTAIGMIYYHQSHREGDMDKQKNLILDQRTWDELDTLMEDSGLSASALIRRLIHEEYDRHLERQARRRELAAKAGP
jgi:hypothetical protein